MQPGGDSIISLDTVSANMVSIKIDRGLRIMADQATRATLICITGLPPEIDSVTLACLFARQQYYGVITPKEGQFAVVQTMNQLDIFILSDAAAKSELRLGIQVVEADIAIDEVPQDVPVYWIRRRH